MRAQHGGIFVGGAIFLAACGAYVDEGESGLGTTALEEGTIARVPNPPKASDLSNLPGDLRTVPIPEPADLSEYIKDRNAAIALGKALFWDMQVGGDGIQACATCHFRAGADPRSKNQQNPGLAHFPQPDFTYSKGGPNYQLTSADFPLTRLATPGVRGELDPSDSNEPIGSQGVVFFGEGPDPLGFRVGSANVRRTTPRNAPSVINAVFNHRQFWDGRAENVFNGANHLGNRDPNAFVLRSDDQRYAPRAVQVRIADASLASQAVGPITNEIEMSKPGATAQEVAQQLTRQPRLLGKRIQKVRPLGKQQVSHTDSVLGSLSRFPQPGLAIGSYDKLVADAFQPQWWDSKLLVRVNDDGTLSFVAAQESDPTKEEYTLLQYNFALIFGLAVQMYEATLVSDDTPWDRFRRQHPKADDPALNPWTNTNPDHISRQALFGAHLFNDRTRTSTNIRCSNCHESAELTDASARRVAAAKNGPVKNRDGNVIDKGFNNIGVRPTDNDLGAGASDAFGPLSFSRRLFPDALPATFDGAAVDKGFGVEGAFKIPSLRNVALTAPYFHNGDARTLREVVELYSRGGNVLPKGLDGTTIEPLGTPALSNEEIDAIVAFLESLTDERVLYRRAPFDHPQLFVPNGHVGNHLVSVDADSDGKADDNIIEINAVGASGGTPIPGFLEGPFAQ